MESICLTVDPGICGFCCQIWARRQNPQSAVIEITGSECKQVRKLAESIKEVSIQDIFTHHTRNPVYKAAEHAGCHLTCSVPIAVLKAAEVALELALPRETCISFTRCTMKERT